jgi:hypothetical protein
MNCDSIKPGVRVRIVWLDDTDGMLVAREHIANRQKGAHGSVQTIVAGHGGDVWLVRHDSGSIGSYCYTEMELE